VDHLTGRELEVLEEMSEAEYNKEIAGIPEYQRSHGKESYQQPPELSWA